MADSNKSTTAVKNRLRHSEENEENKESGDQKRQSNSEGREGLKQGSLGDYWQLAASYLGFILLVLDVYIRISDVFSNPIVKVVVITALFLFVVFWLCKIMWKRMVNYESNRKWFTMSIVPLIAITGVYSLWMYNWINYDTSNQCSKYGLHITSHGSGAQIDHERVEVWGTYAREPSSEIGFLLLNESQSGYGYWPSDPVVIDPVKHEWRGIVYLSGTPPLSANIDIATMGKSGSVLYDYYQQVGGMTGQSISIRLLTDDITICESVSVTRTQ